MPAKNQKSADPVNVGEGITSDMPIRPASKPVMGSESEPMIDASVEYKIIVNAEVGDGAIKARGELVPFSTMGTGGHNAQFVDEPEMSMNRNPNGVESDPKTGKGKLSEPGNFIVAPFGVAEATGERCDGGRSLRSSPGTGKPSTRRREAVDTASRQEEGSSGPVNSGFILDMQRKLYCWSRKSPDQVFNNLFNLICDRRSLEMAWKQLCRNTGSRTPGIDGLTRSKIEKRPGGVNQFLEEVREALRKGIYTPQPVRQRLIPKPGKPGKFRPLGIPTLTDRLVQMALRNVLEPIFEADFYPTSYGFRRGRSTLDALGMIKRQLEPKNTGKASTFEYVIEGDIKGCFDNIDHHLLMERVRRRIGDKKALRLILSFLKAGIMAEGNLRHPATGTPQGGIISPLLANVMLTGIDERYGRWIPRPGETSQKACTRRRWDTIKGRPTFYCVRYADDFVILVSGRKKDAEEEKEALAKYLRDDLHLELSMEKTFVTLAENGFEFLGYKVIKEISRLKKRLTGKLFIPKGKLQLLRNNIKKQTDRSTTGQSLSELLNRLNPQIVGWRNYYKYATGAWKDFMRLDWWLWHRIQGWLRKKHRHVTSHEVRRLYAKRESKTRWTWGEENTLLKRFGQGPRPKYLCRGTKISNGWNDEIDGVSFYPEVTRPISGYTWMMEF